MIETVLNKLMANGQDNGHERIREMDDGNKNDMQSVDLLIGEDTV